MKFGAADPKEGLSTRNLLPLWSIAKDLVHKEPIPSFAPLRWDYAGVVRPSILAIAETVSQEEAERRVLLLTHPAFMRPSTTNTLIAAIQLIKGGEVAEAHRHSQAALRMVIEGEGAVTAVNGERCPMHRGDLILTPSGSWHDHEKSSAGPMIWLDGLDVPLVNYLGVTFFEEFEGGGRHPQSRPEGFSETTFGRLLKPMTSGLESLVHSQFDAPQLRYSYTAAQEALDQMRNAAPPDPIDGWRLRYTNSTTGGHILPTIGAHLQLLPAGFDGAERRSTDSSVVLVLKGAGATRVGATEIEWRENDVLSIPNWSWLSHRASSDAVLFSFSDIALQDKLGLWREERR